MSNYYSRFFLLLIVSISLWSCKSDDDSSAATSPESENKKGLGTSAEDILSSDVYKSLTVELAYAKNFEPTNTAVDAFRTFISERVNKPEGINFVTSIIENQTGGPFSVERIRDIEDEVRTQFTSGDNLAIFVFFSNAKSSNDTDTRVTLGTAYQNTSIVIYEPTLQNLSNNDIELLSRLESTTLHHEFGHILGLTNILGDDIHTNHEDGEQAKHCRVEECLMFFDATNAVSATLQNLMKNGTVPVFDPLCLADLQAKGGK